MIFDDVIGFWNTTCRVHLDGTAAAFVVAFGDQMPYMPSHSGSM